MMLKFGSLRCSGSIAFSCFSSTAASTVRHVPQITKKMAAEEYEGAVMVSTPYTDIFLTQKDRTSQKPLLELQMLKYRQQMKAVRLEYKQEWDYHSKVDEARKRHAYYVQRLNKYYAQRLKDVRRRDARIVWKKREAVRLCKKAMADERKRVNWMKHVAFMKARRNFQREYLLHEKKNYWIEKPEDITEALFDTATALTGYWPEQPQADQESKSKAPELGRFGPLPVVEDVDQVPHMDHVYLDTDEVTEKMRAPPSGFMGLDRNRLRHEKSWVPERKNSRASTQE
eukprot:g69448.t1